MTDKGDFVTHSFISEQALAFSHPYCRSSKLFKESSYQEEEEEVLSKAQIKTSALCSQHQELLAGLVSH